MRSIIIVAITGLLVGTSVASANFVAYVDLAGQTGDANQPNVVRFARPGGGTGPIAGTLTNVLKDYATGANTPVTLAVTPTDATLDESFTVTDYPAGSDAANEFGTIVDNNGYIRHNDAYTANGKINCVFTGLDPAKSYTAVLTGARGGGYTVRTTLFTISDVSSFANTSSTGTTFSGPNDPTDVFNTGENTVPGTGYVARFTNIQPGADGDMTITVGLGNAADKRWYVNQLKLIEVPEPAMMSLLALGLPMITRRRRR